ncbi:hypothetical protein C8R43DRAFT_1039406 [Mycena crocata]|nr:hypothetical protein C8R43DRAFT_1039406 [Mycena crocata]
MTPEELQLIVEFKEKNPGVGVKKTVEGLRASIPSINSKMVRSVVLPGAPVEDPEDSTQTSPIAGPSFPPSTASSSTHQPRSVKHMTPREAEAYSQEHQARVMRELDSAPIAKRPALIQQGEMQALLGMYGHRTEGQYGLLARGDTEYTFERMFWVDVVKGSAAIKTLFARLKVEAVLGHREAVWMLWKLLKSARSDTEQGIRLITDEQIARQLEQELGTNPMDLDADLAVGSTSPSALRLATLLGNIQAGVY